MSGMWKLLRRGAPSLLLLACERRAVHRGESSAMRATDEVLRPSADRAETQPVHDAQSSADAAPRVVRFAWRPPRATGDAYAMDEPEDQHRIVLPRDAAAGSSYPVLVAFHGQPKRGDAPRSYGFAPKVMDTTARAIGAKEVRPLVLVLPVFRYFGTNWPDFDVEAFRDEINRRLAGLGVEASAYYAVGHSGAAGCGGDGMNRVHRMRPAAVGFFDTCLGRGWRDEVLRLRDARIPTLLIHSLETAAFSPRQPTSICPPSTLDALMGRRGFRRVHAQRASSRAAARPTVPLQRR